MSIDDPAAQASNPGSGDTHFEFAVDARDVLGTRPPRAKRPPPSTRCADCGSDEISSLRYFSAGSGVAAHPFSEDVICLPCGHIGPPELLPE